MQSSATTELQQLLLRPTPDFATTHPHQHQRTPATLAHANLQRLRDLGDTNFLFIRCTIELSQKAFSSSNSNLSSTEEELLFHCITGVRHVLLAKWNTTSTVFRTGVRDYLMSLGIQSTMNSSVLSRTIKLAFMNASASLWKRNWVADLQPAASQTQQPVSIPFSAEERTLLETIRQHASSMPSFSTPVELFQYLEGLMLQKTPMETMAAASFVTVLIGEFAGKSSSNYNMPLEFHRKAHDAFEGHYKLSSISQNDSTNKFSALDQALQMSMRSLSQLVPLLLHQTSGITTEQQISESIALAVVQLTIDTIGWECGGTLLGSRALVRPPVSWREMLIQPDFVRAIFQVHNQVVSMVTSASTTLNYSRKQEHYQLAHGLRQLILLLASINGPIFQNSDERKKFAQLLLEGILGLLKESGIASAPTDEDLYSEAHHAQLLDTFSMITRLVVNFKLATLVELPNLLDALFQSVGAIGEQLLQENLKELQDKAGDVELMENREWREEALAMMLESLVLLCGDPFLLYAGSEESRRNTQAALARSLGPLYVRFVTCRTQMARLEEMHYTAHETELDEVREEISAVDVEEEMMSLASIGRLDLGASLACLSGIFQQLVPQIQRLWDGNLGSVTPEAAGLLEESRLVVLYVCHLLTDDNEGETPVIPDSILFSCRNSGGEAVSQAIFGIVQNLQQFAQYQASKIALDPNDPRLSPLLAKSFLWFLHRWAPAYILSVDYSSSKQQNPLVKTWAEPNAVHGSVSFLVNLCLHYHCYWPHEPLVQEHSTRLLHAMAKRCNQMRLAMVSTPAFQQLVSFHCLTSGIRHSASPTEFESTIRAKVGNANFSIDLLRGYQRLPYLTKSNIVTALLVGCSEPGDESSKKLLNDCLKAIHDAFSSLVHVLSTKQTTPDNIDAKEMASLCVELYGGVARAGEMVDSEQIPQFLSPSLPHLSGLMAFYANDLSICESLLRFFRDYAEQFIAVLEPQPCLVLFQSSGELLKSYSSVHCASNRIIIHSAQEEQNYNDILCAIQLLIQLGTKDFISVGDSGGMQTNQVTDMIFFGLQQILPLMTRGLLQFPTLCSQYFSLVGYMMETYPDKVKVLPYELFDALLDSLLFGMSYHDAAVAKCSLQGLAGIVKEHLEQGILQVHLARNSGILDKCSQRLLTEVVFQGTVWDRIEAAGMVLLPLAAVDLQRFAAVVQAVTHQVPLEHHARLTNAFEILLQQDVLSRVSSTGYEGRQNRIRFRKDFEVFCNEIHSFLVVK